MSKSCAEKRSSTLCAEDGVMADCMGIWVCHSSVFTVPIYVIKHTCPFGGVVLVC